MPLCRTLPSENPATKIAVAAAAITHVFFGMPSSSFLVRLRMTVARIRDDEAAVALRGDRDLISRRFVHVRNERLRGVVLRVAGDRIVQLPEILQTRRAAHAGPGLRAAALPRAVVHDGDARVHGVDER